MKFNILLIVPFFVGIGILALYYPIPTASSPLVVEIKAPEALRSLNLTQPTEQLSLRTPPLKERVIHLTEFFDFNCSYCAKAAKTMKVFKEKYGDQLHVTYKNFNIYPSVTNVHKAMICAQAQNKGGDFHDAYFDQFFGQPSSKNIQKIITQIHLNEADFQTCIKSQKPNQILNQHKNEGRTWGVSGTPSLIINQGPLIPGLPRSSELQKMFDEILNNSLK